MVQTAPSALFQKRAYSNSKMDSFVAESRGPSRATNYSTIPGIVENGVKEYFDRDAFGTRVGDKYEWITYGEFGVMVDKFRRVLSQHKIERGDKVTLISNNRVEWAVAMYAVTGLGAALVPMYEAQLEKDWKYIIEDSDAKLALVATDKIYDKVSKYVGNVGKLESVLCMDADEQYMHSYKRWMNLVEKEPGVPVAKINPSEICTIIYTSGTTGNPKGVELSHDNVVANLRGLDDLWRDEMATQTSLAFLPWAHVFGQTAELHSMLAIGSAMGIVSNREQILESLDLIKPTVILSVPVLFNKVYDGVQKKVGEGSPVAKKLFTMAMAVARERNHMLEFGQTPGALLNFKHSIADKLVLSKIRDKLGGRMEFFCAGGAATSVTVLQFFEDIGIPICEGYGLTETSPVMTSGANNWETRRLGCVGVPLKGNTIRIIDPHTMEPKGDDEEGEICQAGGNIMTGYRNNDAANKEVFFHADGMKFFRTGDLGKMVEGKFLKVTGRIKEQFKLENGKYVVPAPLEDAITRSQFIAQSLLYGDNQPHTVVLIVPDILTLKEWGANQGLPEMELSEYVKQDEVVRLLTSEITAACQALKAYERPTRFVPLGEAFSADNQMLTPKLSLRRNNILAAHQAKIDDMYTGAVGYNC